MNIIMEVICFIVEYQSLLTLEQIYMRQEFNGTKMKRENGKEEISFQIILMFLILVPIMKRKW